MTGSDFSFYARVALTIGPEAGAKWLFNCAMIELANEYDCPQCGHKMAYHNGLRECCFERRQGIGGCQCREHR